MSTSKERKTNSYTNATWEKIADNNQWIEKGDFVRLVNGYISLAGNSDPIEWTSRSTIITWPNNTTVDKLKVNYKVIVPTDTVSMKVVGWIPTNSDVGCFFNLYQNQAGITTINYATKNSSGWQFRLEVVNGNSAQAGHEFTISKNYGWQIWPQWYKGDTWSNWPQWPQGIRWPIGLKWDTGDKGDKWDTGNQWPQWPQGIQGIQGIQWPIWPQWQGFTNRWTWSWWTSYNSYDVVYYLGSSYLCISPNINNAPPGWNRQIRALAWQDGLQWPAWPAWPAWWPAWPAGATGATWPAWPQWPMWPAWPAVTNGYVSCINFVGTLNTNVEHIDTIACWFPAKTISWDIEMDFVSFGGYSDTPSMSYAFQYDIATGKFYVRLTGWNYGWNGTHTYSTPRVATPILFNRYNFWTIPWFWEMQLRIINVTSTQFEVWLKVSWLGWLTSDVKLYMTLNIH